LQSRFCPCVLSGTASRTGTLLTVDRRPWTDRLPAPHQLQSGTALFTGTLPWTVDRSTDRLPDPISYQAEQHYLPGPYRGLWTVDRRPITPSPMLLILANRMSHPVSLLIHLLLLHKQVEVHLRHLEVTDIAVGSDAAR